MTKRELIEELAPYDDNTVVAVYVQEAMDVVGRVQLEKRTDEEKLYCKEDHVLEWNKDLDEVLVIY